MFSRFRIPEVALRVTDLESSVRFYTDLLRFSVQDSRMHETAVGIGEGSVLRLIEEPGAVRFPSRPGLYHVALLFPSRPALAHSVRHLLEAGHPISGAADHLVSEAVYLDDPEGNGIELYWDRPRESWPWVAGGLRMDSLPLDLAGLLHTARQEGDNGPPPATSIGHVHLQVNDLEKATRFYQDGLGLSLMQRFGPSAAFLSAAGYHHHVGLNTWRSAGAEPRPVGAAGLAWCSFEVGSPGEIDEAAERAGRLGAVISRSAGSARLQDPSGNEIRLVSE